MMAIIAFHLILFLLLETSAALNIFDTRSVPTSAELITIDVSRAGAERDTSRSSTSTSTEEEINALPGQVQISFLCRGRRLNLALKHYPNTNGRIESGNTTYNSFGDAIPVFTRTNPRPGGGDGRDLVMDNFPRFFTSSCRTYRDSKHLAVFLGILDPSFGSLKFFGSFTMDGIQYFIQPYTSKEDAVSDSNRGRGQTKSTGTVLRHHVMEELPVLDYSLDTGVTSLLETLNDHGIKWGNLSVPSDTKTGRGFGRRQSRRRGSSKTLNNNSRNPQGSSSSPRSSRGNRKTNTLFTKRNRNQKNKQLGDRYLSSRSRSGTSAGLVRQRRDTAYDNAMVEVFIVCDYLCYKRFQDLYEMRDHVMTKNLIAQFFTYAQEFYSASFAGVAEMYPEEGISIGIRVVGLYIATDPRDKIIGEYGISDDGLELETYSSAFEFALWVEDNLRVTHSADHYALVTGYDLSGVSQGIIGVVTNIPSVCQLDGISLNELILPIVAQTMAHELGHSLGSQHDGLTGGVCTDEQQFIMGAIIGGPLIEENQGNPFRFSHCSASFFKEHLPTRGCVHRDDFPRSSLPATPPRIGQSFTLDQQCAALVDDSIVCRSNVSTTVRGSWDGICSNTPCSVPDLPGLCFPIAPLQYTSCGNRRWCINGKCRDSPEAPEKVVDCPAGDSPAIRCRVDQCSNRYDDVTRFIDCCDTCRPIKTVRYVTISSK